MGYQNSKIEEPIMNEIEYMMMTTNDVKKSFEYLDQKIKNTEIELSDQDIDQIRIEINKIDKYNLEFSNRIDSNHIKSEFLKKQLEHEKCKIEEIKKIISELEDTKSNEREIIGKPVSYIDCILELNPDKKQRDLRIVNLVQENIKSYISMINENNDLESANRNLIQEIDKINKEGIALFNRSVQNV